LFETSKPFANKQKVIEGVRKKGNGKKGNGKMGNRKTETENGNLLELIKNKLINSSV